MNLMLFRSLWTNGGRLAAALDDCRSGPFHGVEGPVPSEAARRRDFLAQLRDAGAPFIAELTTGGGYVPEPSAGFAKHLEDFRRKLDAACECAPLFVTALAGSDAWPLARSVDFFGQAMDLATEAGVAVSFETHRSRATFHPWITRELLLQLPAMELTCDFSHWCCVCERLVLDTEPEVLALCAERARHIHARVGYEQGPQVAHPGAPEHRQALEAHERWWDALWTAQRRKGRKSVTMTPEFGPDGYLQMLPFTQTPVASLDEVNRWMAERQRNHFEIWQRSLNPAPSLQPI